MNHLSLNLKCSLEREIYIFLKFEQIRTYDIGIIIATSIYLFLFIFKKEITVLSNTKYIELAFAFT